MNPHRIPASRRIASSAGIPSTSRPPPGYCRCNPLQTGRFSPSRPPGRMLYRGNRPHGEYRYRPSPIRSFRENMGAAQPPVLVANENGGLPHAFFLFFLSLNASRASTHSSGAAVLPSGRAAGVYIPWKSDPPVVSRPCSAAKAASRAESVSL